MILKTFQVILSKSYIVTIKARSEEEAVRLSEFYTDDIKDISTNKERVEKGFSIKKLRVESMKHWRQKK